MTEPIGVVVHLSPAPGAEGGEPEILWNNIWQCVSDFLQYYTAGPETEQIWQDYLSAVTADASFATVESDQLGFWFNDQQGSYTRSAELSQWWFKLAFAACLDQIDAFASDLGWVVDQPRYTVRQLLERPTKTRFMKTRNQLYLVYGDLQEFAICGDGATQEMTDKELHQAQQLMTSNGTDDPLANMLLPAENFAAKMVAHLGDSDLETRKSAIWYLGNSANPGASVLAALFAATDDEDPDVVELTRNAIEKLARQADIAETALTFTDSEVPNQRATALWTLPDLVQRHCLTADVALDLLLPALHGPTAVAAAAAERIGFLTLPESREPEIVQLLLTVLADRREEAGYAALISLINIHINRKQVPDSVSQALVKVAEQEDDLQELAEWALDIFAQEVEGRL